MNLAEILEGHDADSVALVHRGDDITYGQLRADIDRLRAQLVGLGLGSGDRVAILNGITPRFIVGFLAAVGGGMVAVPLNPLTPPSEVERELAVVGAKAAIVGPTGATAMAGVDRSQLPDLEHVIAWPGVDLAGAVALGDLPEAPEVPVARVGGDDLAVLLFTSGTAGAPKPAMLTHGNLLANLEQVHAHSLELIAQDDVVLLVIPLFHIQGLNATAMGTLRTGAALVLMERFDPTTALEVIRDERVSRVSGPPTMWSAFASLPEAPADAFADVRLAFSGAAPLPDAVARAIQDRFGIRVFEGYGLTEASPVVTLAVETTPLGSVGRPIPGVQVRLVDEDGEDVLIGDPGEVWVRGPNVFPGYWDEPEATARVLTSDGWLRTGDIAVVDEAGQVRLIDRAKDMILVSGFNVYPAEVESVVGAHPAVEAAAVVGIAHPHHGEAVKAFVVPRPGASVEEDQLVSFCETRLAHYKCPVAVAVVDELPMTASGKVVRRDLN